MRQTYEAMIALEFFSETQVTMAAAGSLAPGAAMASASLTSAAVAGLTVAMVTPAKRHDERRRV